MNRPKVNEGYRKHLKQVGNVTWREEEQASLYVNVGFNQHYRERKLPFVPDSFRLVRAYVVLRDSSWFALRRVAVVRLIATTNRPRQRIPGNIKKTLANAMRSWLALWLLSAAEINCRGRSTVIIGSLIEIESMLKLSFAHDSIIQQVHSSPSHFKYDRQPIVSIDRGTRWSLAFTLYEYRGEEGEGEA